MVMDGLALRRMAGVATDYSTGGVWSSTESVATSTTKRRIMMPEVIMVLRIRGRWVFCAVRLIAAGVVGRSEASGDMVV